MGGSASSATGKVPLEPLPDDLSGQYADSDSWSVRRLTLRAGVLTLGLDEAQAHDAVRSGGFLGLHLEARTVRCPSPQAEP